MMPFMVCLAAFGIVFFSMQMGFRMGAFLALSGMLGSMLGALVAFRYWFLISELAERQEAPVVIHTLIIFWAIFCGVAFLFYKVRSSYVDVFESLRPSLMDRVLGGLFGLGNGMVVMAALMMTFSMAASAWWPGYEAGQLPLPVDQWAEPGYRFVEMNVAGVGPADRGHTPLPRLDEKGAKTAAEVWR